MLVGSQIGAQNVRLAKYYSIVNSIIHGCFTISIGLLIYFLRVELINLFISDKTVNEIAVPLLVVIAWVSINDSAAVFVQG